MQTGSGFGAFNISTPTEATDSAAAARIRAIQSQLADATLPDEIEQSRTKTATSQLALADARTSSLARQTQTDEALIANAAALAQDADSWDAAMQALADKGVPEAKQFIGRFSTKLQGRVAGAYGAPTAHSALEAMQSDNPTGVGAAQSGLASVGGQSGEGVSAGATANNFDQLFANHSPQELQAAFQHLEKMRTALDAISNSSNPSAEWDRQAQALGLPNMVGGYSPQAMQQATQETVPLDNYLRGRLTREGMGVPTPKLPAKIDKVGDQMFAVDESDPAHPKVTPLTEGKSTFVGLNSEGKGVYYNPDTHKETVGTETISAPRYGSRGGNSVFAQKQAAWLGVHPGDAQGAMEFAAGRKTMTPQQIHMAALSAATRELSAMALSGSPPPDGEAFITERTTQIEQQLQSTGAPEAGGAGGGAPKMRGGYPVLTPAQSRQWAADPANKGKHFWGADGSWRTF